MKYYDKRLLVLNILTKNYYQNNNEGILPSEISFEHKDLLPDAILKTILDDLYNKHMVSVAILTIDGCDTSELLYNISPEFIEHFEKIKFKGDKKTGSNEQQKVDQDLLKDFKDIKKEYKSLTRARAFCIMEMYLNKKIAGDVMESKNKIIELAEKIFPKKSGDTVYSGKTIYLTLKTEECLYSDIENQKTKYPSDYKYGLKLYKEKFPD